MQNYQIITDATADLPAELGAKIDVVTIPMDVDLDGKTYSYTPGAGELTPELFYNSMREGKKASTTQINPLVYEQTFERYLKEGLDVLYICFSSALSATIQVASLCIEQLREKYPERKICYVDSLCASVGEGFFVHAAAQKQKEGMDIDELLHWLEENRLQVCHWFTVDDLEYLRRSGRLSSLVAAIGGTLNIKPVLHVDDIGRLVNVEKVHGRKKSISAMVKHMETAYMTERKGTVFIGHGDCIEDAERMAALVKGILPDTEIQIFPIGPIIGAHCGPGVLALFFWGKER